MLYLFSFILSALLVTYLIPKILLLSFKLRLVDKPNSRKIHSENSSRLGGVAFCPSIFISLFVVTAVYSVVFYNGLWSTIITSRLVFGSCACFVMYFVGLFDDIKTLKNFLKFYFQLFAALIIVCSGLWIKDLHGILGVNELAWWVGVPLSIMLIVFVMNSINLIDGIDGLSSGLSIVALAAFGVVFAQMGKISSAMLAFSTVGVLVGFIRYNLFGLKGKNVKIFMGDAGSLVVGTVIGMLSISMINNLEVTQIAAQRDVLIAFSVLIVPCMDVFRVMLHRYRAGMPIFMPDKNHIHHKFMQIGFGQRSTLLIILGIALIFLGFNLLMFELGLSVPLIVVVDIVVWSVMHVMLSRYVCRMK